MLNDVIMLPWTQGW